MDFESPTLSQRSGSPPSLTLSLTGLALAGLGGGWRLGPRAGLALAGLGGWHGAAVVLRCGALALLCTSSFIYFNSTVLQCTRLWPGALGALGRDSRSASPGSRQFTGVARHAAPGGVWLVGMTTVSLAADPPRWRWLCVCFSAACREAAPPPATRRAC